MTNQIVFECWVCPASFAQLTHLLEHVGEHELARTEAYIATLRRPYVADITNHGVTGYKVWHCRCAVCVEAGAANNRRYYKKHRKAVAS